MAKDEVEVIEITDSPCRGSKIMDSPCQKGTPLRQIFCLKNRDEIKKYEDKEECFILEFDPYDNFDVGKLSVCKGFDNAEADLRLVAEKGKVACRDYPHSRNTCAKFPFQNTPHESYCELCYCYVCDKAAPCEKWEGSCGHCHAFNNEAWNTEKRAIRNSTMNSETQHVHQDQQGVLSLGEV